jgi:hypothetical protein
LINEDGRDVSVGRDELTRTATAAGEKSATYALSRQLPLKDVSPGRYLLRVEAQLRGDIEGETVVTRETAINISGE